MPYHQLKKFALWFHQDFNVIFDTTDEGVNTYLQSLTAEDMATLSSETANFLNEYSGRDHRGLRNAWIRLGAQWWNQHETPELLEKLSKVKVTGTDQGF